MNEPFPEIEAIEPPVPDGTWPWWLIALAVCVAAAALAGLAWWRWRKRHPAEVRVPTPKEIAIEALGRFRARVGEIDGSALSVAVADVLREFVTAGYGVPATRQTSQEFLDSASRSPWFDGEDREALAEILGLCDMVKFAGIEATVAEGSRLLDEAARFVNRSPEKERVEA
jgi:hypothetical protein